MELSDRLDIDVLQATGSSGEGLDPRRDILLRFKDPSIERQFSDDFAKSSRHRLRWAALAGCVMQTVFGLVDLLSIKPPGLFVVVRLGVLVPMLLFTSLLTLWRKGFKASMVPLVVLVYLSNIAFFCVYNTFENTGFEDGVTPPTIVPALIVSLFVFVRVPFVYGLGCGVATVVFYLATFAARNAVPATGLGGHNLVLVAALLMGALGGYTLESSARTDFFTIISLERRHTQVTLEKKRAGDLLLNTLPPPIASRLLDNSRRGNPDETICERYPNVTICFISLTNLHLTHATPKLIVENLNHIYSVFDAILDTFGVEKIKAIGSTYMVASGCPYPNAEHCQAMARVALNIVHVVDAMNRANAASGVAPLNLLIGMHSGEVVGGVIGRAKFAFDVYGDTVNMASRMKATSLPDVVQISAASHALLSSSNSSFITQKRGEILVKGKGLVTTHWLLGEKSAADVPLLLPPLEDKAAEAGRRERRALMGLGDSDTDSSSWGDDDDDDDDDDFDNGFDSNNSNNNNNNNVGNNSNENPGKAGRGKGKGVSFAAGDSPPDKAQEKPAAGSDVARARRASMVAFEQTVFEQNRELTRLDGRNHFLFPMAEEKRFLKRFFAHSSSYVALILLVGIMVDFANEYIDYAEGDRDVWLWGWVIAPTRAVLLLAAVIFPRVCCGESRMSMGTGDGESYPTATVLTNGIVTLLNFALTSAALVLLAAVDQDTPYFRSQIILVVMYQFMIVRVQTLTVTVVFLLVAAGAAYQAEDRYAIAASCAYVPLLMVLAAFFSEHYIRRDYLLWLRMTEEQAELDAEKSRCETLLSNVLPPEIITEMQSGLVEATAIAHSYQDAVILASDLVGFTAMSATLTARELVDILNAIFSEFDRHARDLGVTKHKTIGDAYIAFAGVWWDDDHIGQDPVESVMELALRMHRSLAEYNESHGTSIAMRIGIHMGTVMGGVIGTRRAIFDIFGKTMNFAELMESSGVPGKTHVSQIAHDRVAHKFRFTKRKATDKAMDPAETGRVIRRVPSRAGMPAIVNSKKNGDGTEKGARKRGRIGPDGLPIAQRVRFHVDEDGKPLSLEGGVAPPTSPTGGPQGADELRYRLMQSTAQPGKRVRVVKRRPTGATSGPIVTPRDVLPNHSNASNKRHAGNSNNSERDDDEYQYYEDEDGDGFMVALWDTFATTITGGGGEEEEEEDEYNYERDKRDRLDEAYAYYEVEVDDDDLDDTQITYFLEGRL